MPLDDVIELLQSIRAQNGNIPVIDDDNHPVEDIEYNDDDFPAVVITFGRAQIDG